jgi:hypothetical protein
MEFFNKLLDARNAGKPLMRPYLEGYFDLYWDLHLGVKGDAIDRRPSICARHARRSSSVSPQASSAMSRC